MFDRTLLRAGETVSMKHFIRTETATGLAAVPAAKLPTTVKLVHQGSGQEFDFPLQWSGGGRSAATTWNIPPAAKLGVYEVSLERPDAADAKARAGGEGEGEGEARAAQLDERQLPGRGVPPAAGRRAPRPGRRRCRWRRRASPSTCR